MNAVIFKISIFEHEIKYKYIYIYCAIYRTIDNVFTHTVDEKPVSKNITCYKRVKKKKSATFCSFINGIDYFFLLE